MLEEMGLDLVMIGHSERRHVFGESDVEENKKVKAALSHGLRHYCVSVRQPNRKNMESVQRLCGANSK